MSRVFQLRTYKSRDADGREDYKEGWRRHMVSAPKFGVTVHGVWIPQSTVGLQASDPNNITESVLSANENEIWTLASFSRAKAEEIDEAYLPTALADLEGLDTKLAEVRATWLDPLDYSPLI